MLFNVMSKFSLVLVISNIALTSSITCSKGSWLCGHSGLENCKWDISTISKVTQLDLLFTFSESLHFKLSLLIRISKTLQQ